MTKPPFTSSWEVPDAASWQRTGDRLADLVIESGLFKPSAIKYENILRLLAAKERQQQQLAKEQEEKEKEEEKQNKKKLKAEVLIYREIIDELERVPAWVDWTRIERGRQIYRDHLVLINAGLAVALIEAYSFPIDAQVLYISGGLTASRRAATRRLMETGYWVFTVMKEGLRVGSKGHAACVNVRLIHALARKLCLLSPEWASDARRRGEPTTDGPDETLLMKFVKLSAQHQTSTEETAGNQSQNTGDDAATPQRVHGELPINQANLLGTLFLFCHVCLEVACMRGARLTQEDKESYWHMWRYIGHLLGIDEGLMPATYDDGLAARLGELYRARQQPDHTSRLLAVSTVDAMASLPSIPFNRPLFNVSIRRFLGHSLCDALGIESVNVVTTAQWWVSKYVYVLCDLFNAVLPPMQRLQSGLFWRFVDEVYRDYFTIHLHPTTTSMGAFCPVLASPAPAEAGGSAPKTTPPEMQMKMAPTATTTAKQWLRCPFGG